MTDEQFKQIKALLLMNSFLLMNLINKGNAEGHENEICEIMRNNFEQIMQALRHSDDPAHILPDLNLDLHVEIK